MTTTPELKRLRQVLDAYGADPAHWPAAERATLAAVSAGELAALRQEAAEIDRILGRATMPAVPENGIERLLGAARREAIARADNGATAVAPELAARQLQAPRAPAGRWWSAVALAGCLVAGVYLGLTGYLAPYLPGQQLDISIQTASLQDQTNLDDPFALLEFDNL